MERLVPPRKDRVIEFAMPPVTSADDAAKAIGAVLAAVAEGRITPAEAAAVAGLVESCRRAIGPEAPAARVGANINVTFRQLGDLPS